MRIRACLPPGAAMILLGSCLFILFVTECEAEVAGRQIRRITSSDLPSSNNTDVSKTKIKKFQSIREPNCTLNGSCSSSSTSSKSTDDLESSTKGVSSFVADDDLQGRLHLTTASPSYAEDLESFFEDTSISFEDDFENKTSFPREVSSFRDYNYSVTEGGNFGDTLTTPRISLFDDFHDRLTEGIHQNLDTDDHRFRNTEQKQGVNIPKREQVHDPTKKKEHESVTLEFSKNLSLVYNDSSSPISITRNVVIENGTRINLEKSSIHTEVEPEFNKSIVYYFTNESYSSELPETESIPTEDSGNNDTELQSIKNDTLSKPIKFDHRSSTNRYASSAKNVILKKTGTPGDKESTTSEPIRGRSYNKSREQISNRINDNYLSESSVVTNINNTETSTPVSINDSVTVTNSAKTAKDLKSNKVTLGYPGRTLSNRNSSRNGKMLISRSQSNVNSSNSLDESPETSQLGSSENSLTRDQMKKTKLRNGLRRTGFNKTEEQVEASNTSLSAAMESENSSVLTKKPDETIISTEDFITTTEPEEVTSTEYSNSSRSRAFTFRRTYSGTSTSAPDRTSTASERISSTTKSSNIETVRQRLSTMRRRLETSTEPTYTVISSSNFTTESNAIVRGWPGIPRRSTVPRLSQNGSLSESIANNEGNDIITTRTNTFKPINRSRGSVRYGSPRNNTFDSDSNANDSSFPLPSSATAWTLVTLRGPGNETRSAIQNDTSAVNSTTRIVATSMRWSPIRGKKPWSTSQPATTTAYDTKNPWPFSTTMKPTRLRPVTDKKLPYRIGSTKTQQSSMQENRVSQTHINPPTTELSEDMTQDPLSTTTTENEDDISTTTTFLQSTSTDSDITTITDSTSTFDTSTINIPSDSLLTTESQNDDTTTADAPTTTEISDNISTTTDSETTVAENDTSTSGITTAESSTQYDSSTVTTVTDDQVITTQGRFQDLPNPFPTLDIPQIGPYEDENDNQQPDSPEIDSGGNAGMYPDVNNPGEEMKGNNNPGNGNLDEGNRQGNGEEMKVDGINIDSQDLPHSSGDDIEENKNSDGNRQIYEGQNPGEKFPSAGDEQEEAADDNVPLDLKTEAPPPVTVPVTTTMNPVEDDSQTRTATSPGTESAATASWSSSSISTVEWDSSDMNKEEQIGNSFYLRLSVQATWEDFCSGTDQFKAEVAEIMTNNHSPILKDQVVLNTDECRESEVRYARSSEIQVPLYLVGSDGKLDLLLTKAFFDLWKEGKLNEITSFKIISVNAIQPGQTKTGDGNTQDEITVVHTSTVDSSSDGTGPGMIAAITISCIGAVCLLLLAILWIVMRKRQQRFNYGQRCTPVSLDAYSLDSVSVCGSVRRKGVIRSSKRSYGNAGFDDPSIPTHPVGFAGLANFITNRAAVEEEFANIPHVTANVDEIPEGADTKNRYANVIPLPETRVQLTPVEGEPLSDYINANFVHGPKGAKKYYIACQAPLNTTVTDFWRMIWEQQSKVILMLTDLVENGAEKCADYLPPSEVLDCHRLFGDFQITLKKREVKEKYIISTLQLKNLETNSWREVMHLWYVSWPTQGVPDDPSSVIAFLLEARPYMRGGPCVVHCSPGTGRTGTVIASDLCIRDFETSRIVDIPRCVAQLRRDRAGSVQTRDQYFFIYQVINLYGAKLTGSALDSM